MFTQHLRSNAVAYLALFVAMTGTATAVNVAAKNSVTSKSIKNQQVKSVDLAPDAVAGASVADGSLTGADVGANSLTGADVGDNSLTGADVDEGQLSVGGVLSGTLGAAKLTGHAVTRDDVSTTAGKVLTGANIDESTLSGVDAAKLGGRAPSDFVISNAANSATMWTKLVDTSTAAAGTVVLTDGGRFTLETTGTAHQFMLCSHLALDTPQPVAYVNGPSAVFHATSIPADGNCTAALSTGGSGSGSGGVPGMLQIFAGNSSIFIGPGTQNFATSTVQTYQVNAIGFDLE